MIKHTAKNSVRTKGDKDKAKPKPGMFAKTKSRARIAPGKPKPGQIVGTAEALARRRKISGWMRAARALARN
jgi:hypothetical protein